MPESTSWEGRGGALPFLLALGSNQGQEIADAHPPVLLPTTGKMSGRTDGCEVGGMVDDGLRVGWERAQCCTKRVAAYDKIP